MKRIHSDLALLDVSLPQGAEADPFYTTLLYIWMRALMVAFNLDEGELDGFLAPSPRGESPCRIVLYETSVGGSGVLASLAEPGRLETAVARARELLHEGDPEGGCDRACYDCLLSFYNQRYHELLNRALVLPVLQALEELEIEPIPEMSTGPSFDELDARCQSGLERQVLAAICDRGLPLPDAAQKTVYDGDAPIATADFFYAPRILVFVDGSPHYRDYVAAADQRKRRRLKALGYRILAITGDGLEEALSRLKEWLGLGAA